MRRLHGMEKAGNGAHSIVKARLKLAFLGFTAILASASDARPEFSHAHQRLAQYYQSNATLSIDEAFWLRHNHLILSTSSENAKEITKTVCNHLLASGFASERPQITAVAHDSLQNRNSWNILAQRECN